MRYKTFGLAALAAASLLVGAADAAAQQVPPNRARTAQAARPHSVTSLRSELRAELALRRPATPAQPAQAASRQTAEVAGSK